MTRPFRPNRKTRIIWAADEERERRHREFWAGFWAWAISHFRKASADD